MNPLSKLNEYGQSFWLDYIQRSLMTSGELKRLINEDGLRGMTSNPTIFQKAFINGKEYDQALKKAAQKNKSTYDVFEEVAIQDIQKAADVLRPVYNKSQATDGYVSLEVNPKLAFDTEGTIQEAKKLVKKVKRPNLMIKVPGTKEGLPAIQALLTAGININITLLFSVDVYKDVLEAYIKALEARVRKGLPIKKLASVASFFVSRVDTLIDKQLDEKIAAGGSSAEASQKLLHKIAVANAKLAYEHYLSQVESPRFQKLKKKGAQVQRLLWASTGTKDKRLPDTYYIDELIGADTVNTMPPATADAFREHGTLGKTLAKGFDEARASLGQLSELGVSIDKATQTLQEKGVESFVKSFDGLLQVVGAKCELLAGNHQKNVTFSLGRFENDFQETLERITNENWIKRIWAKDASLWKSEDDHQKIIKNALGWLTVMNTIEDKIPFIEGLVKDIRKGKFTHALLLGMGGSSLCPEVLRLTFGKKGGYPDLAILDSTEPSSVIERAKRSKPEKTLYIVASKSGSTTEPNAFLAYFYEEVRKKKKGKAGENFVAITDPGTSMEKTAKEKNFRHIIFNPPDIGGRYSALSFFGMFPAALMGIPVKDFIQKASRMAAACSPYTPVEKNPGALLGAAMGTMAKAGNDKLTFFISKEIGSLGTWLEQLIAESTGKEGKGILPVESEPIQSPEYYGSDRIFVHITTSKDKDKSVSKKVASLEKAGFPVVRINMNSKIDLGAEFFRWEMATAVAGALLGINPFDQPNVQEAKDLTKKLLNEYVASGEFEKEKSLYQEPDTLVYSSNGQTPGSSFEEILGDYLRQVQPNDYVSILAYIRRDARNWAILQSIRQHIQKSKKVATTIGFGPRFLHSTGQLHKGGSGQGVFITITADDMKDLPIPGQTYSYAILKEAQARGDWGALVNRGRRALHIHLKDLSKGLTKLEQMVKKVY